MGNIAQAVRRNARSVLGHRRAALVLAEIDAGRMPEFVPKRMLAIKVYDVGMK